LTLPHEREAEGSRQPTIGRIFLPTLFLRDFSICRMRRERKAASAAAALQDASRTVLTRVVYLTRRKISHDQNHERPIRREWSRLASPKREVSQVTLSAIGDVSVAATEAVSRVGATSTRTRWLPILSFLFLVYIAGSLAAIYAHNSSPGASVRRATGSCPDRRARVLAAASVEKPRA